jgi:formate dehydrogenase major subunit
MAQPSLIPTICPYCGVGCGLYVAVEDGRAVGLEHMPEHPVSEGALCPRGGSNQVRKTELIIPGES